MPTRTKDTRSDAERVVMEYRLSSTELLRVLVRPYKTLTLIDIRRFYADLNGDLQPGKGISLTRTSAPLVRKALGKAIKLLEENND